MCTAVGGGLSAEGAEEIPWGRTEVGWLGGLGAVSRVRSERGPEAQAGGRVSGHSAL